MSDKTFSTYRAIANAYYTFMMWWGRKPYTVDINPITKVRTHPAKSVKAARELTAEQMKACLAAIERRSAWGKRAFSLFFLWANIRRRVFEMTGVR